MFFFFIFFFFFKQKTAYEMAQCDWSSDVCSSDLDRDVEPHDDFQLTQFAAAAGGGVESDHPLQGGRHCEDRLELFREGLTGKEGEAVGIPRRAHARRPDLDDVPRRVEDFHPELE